MNANGYHQHGELLFRMARGKPVEVKAGDSIIMIDQTVMKDGVVVKVTAIHLPCAERGLHVLDLFVPRRRMVVRATIHEVSH